MIERGDLLELLSRWFAQGDELAHRRAYEELSRQLVCTREARQVLGEDAADEIRQDVLVRLLDGADGKLRAAKNPVAYAKTAWRHSLASTLRKWGPREGRKNEVERHLILLSERDEYLAVEDRIDAGRALKIAENLTDKGRLAVLLTTEPNRIASEDWQALIAELPPPPPSRPEEPLNREDASRLLYPPKGPEDAKQRYQRLNSFNKAFKRAIEKIRSVLEVEL